MKTLFLIFLLISSNVVASPIKWEYSILDQSMIKFDKILKFNNSKVINLDSKLLKKINVSCIATLNAVWITKDLYSESLMVSCIDGTSKNTYHFGGAGECQNQDKKFDMKNFAIMNAKHEVYINFKCGPS